MARRAPGGGRAPPGARRDQPPDRRLRPPLPGLRRGRGLVVAARRGGGGRGSDPGPRPGGLHRGDHRGALQPGLRGALPVRGPRLPGARLQRRLVAPGPALHPPEPGGHAVRPAHGDAALRAGRRPRGVERVRLLLARARPAGDELPPRQPGLPPGAAGPGPAPRPAGRRIAAGDHGDRDREPGALQPGLGPVRLPLQPRLRAVPPGGRGAGSERFLGPRDTPRPARLAVVAGLVAVSVAIQAWGVAWARTLGW